MQEKLEQISKNYSSGDQKLIVRAFKFAKEAHSGQNRKSGEEYIHHPLETASILANLNLDASTLAAALLHDVPEDTDKQLAQIEKHFGAEIAYLVNGLTKLSKVRLRGSYEPAYVENLRRMFIAAAEDLRVVLIKLADRLHNMRTLDALPADKQEAIAKETLEIYAPLANRLGMGEIKGELEDLSFPYVYPNEYRNLISKIGKAYDSRKVYVKRATKVFDNLLRQNEIKLMDIHGRAKHIYSLYNKLKRYETDDLNRITDLVAIRVILPTTSECYAAMGLIHEHYKPLPGKIKDYISVPKPNGYQSLHTTVFGPEGEVVELQIRTETMHKYAEHGIAAHWSYTESGKPKEGGNSGSGKLAWIKQLREMQEDYLKEPKEFLEALELDFFKDRIFCFTPQGDVIDLPADSTPIDFAFAVHTDLGTRCIGAKINGVMKKLSEPLNNGDVVEIITMKNPVKMSRDWLRSVKTSKARASVRKALREKGEIN